MLTQNLYRVFTEAIKGQQQLYVAVGAGQPGWDQTQPDTDRRVTQLVTEVGRKAAAPEAVVFLDEHDNVVTTPTPRLQVAVTFGGGEAVGTLRECGLFGEDATARPGSGVLLAYYVHEKVEKTVGTPLARRLVIDLMPADAAQGRRLTRYLGNTRTRELHDLDAQTPRCQVDEIALDRRYYFATVPEAQAMGYDFCAHCFGPDRSTR